MSLESFTGFESGEGMSESAFEAFKEKMKVASAQIAAIKKEEGKQKKKEENLHRILLKFIQKSDKRELCLLISRALEQNIPANFILAVILLGNEDIQKEVGKFIMLPGAPEKEAEENQSALTFFDPGDKALPLKLKIEVDNWIKNMLYQAQETPQKLIKTAYDIKVKKIPGEGSFSEAEYKETKRIKSVLPRLLAFVLRDFMEKKGAEVSYKKLSDFANFIIKGILTKVEESLGKRKEIKGEVSPTP